MSHLRSKIIDYSMIYSILYVSSLLFETMHHSRYIYKPITVYKTQILVIFLGSINCFYKGGGKQFTCQVLCGTVKWLIHQDLCSYFDSKSNDLNFTHTNINGVSNYTQDYSITYFAYTSVDSYSTHTSRL